MAEPLKFRPDDFTIGDLEDFEAITGEPLLETVQKLQEPGAMPPIKIVKALVWLVKRSTDPTFSVDDARNIRVSEIIIDYTPDPTPARNGTDSVSAPPSATSGA